MITSVIQLLKSSILKQTSNWECAESLAEAFALKNGDISPENDWISGLCSLAVVDSKGRWVCWFYQTYHCHDDCSIGCVTSMLRNLGPQSLQIWRQHQWLTFFSKIVRRLTHAIHANEFLTPISSKRLIKPRSPTDFKTTNIVTDHARNNSQSYRVDPAKTAVYR